MDCGKPLRRRAEICPYCGCRQVRSPGINWGNLSSAAGGETGSAFATRMAILIGLNVLWNGLGNLAIGDKRGWRFGIVNWIVFALAVFSAFVPSVLFFVYCTFQGYTYLQQKGDDKK
jgi:hypothetical protein